MEPRYTAVKLRLLAVDKSHGIFLIPKSDEYMDEIDRYSDE